MISVFKSETAREKVLTSYEEVLKAWGTDFEEHYVDTRFGRTYCLTAGQIDYPPLLMFHGVGDNSALMWALNMKELSRHFYCIAVDTLGGPGKSVPNERYVKKLFSQTEWIDEIAEAFGLNSINLAGVSNGAYMAYQYTAARPERVGRTVCLEGGMVTNPFKSMIRTLLIMFPEVLVPTDNNLRKIIRKLCAPSSNVFDRHPLLEEHLVLLMRGHNQQAMFPHRLEKYNQEQGMAVRDKLYFLLGDYHVIVKKDFMSLLESGGFRYSIVPGAGHAINHEQPDLVHRELISFILGERLSVDPIRLGR